MKASLADDFAGRSIFFLVLFLSSAVAQGQTIVRVSPDGTGNGSSWAQASSLTDAVTNSPEGTELWLKEGVYTVTQVLEFTEYEHAGMSLYGGFAGTETARSQRDSENNKTILDGGGGQRIIDIDVDNITANGLTFRNGYVPKGAETGGGAIYISGSGTTLRNCIFRNNISEGVRGAGAIYNRGGSGLLIDRCLFENNKTQNYVGDANGGGAIHNWADEVTITNTTFRNNSSHNSGGAIYSWYNDEIHIDNCVFQGNHSSSWGGALHLRSEPTISNTRFIENSSVHDGGAIYSGEKLHLDKVSFFNNSVTNGRGGAIYLNYGAETSIVNTLFAGNEAGDKGGALYFAGSLSLANATFVNNRNHAIAGLDYQVDLVNIYNSIFFDNTAPGETAADISLSVEDMPASAVSIRKNILQSAIDPPYASGNQVGVDPLFVDAASGDYTLQTASLARDAGENALFNQVSSTNAGASTDLEGADRVQGPSIDLGPYELEPSTITRPDCAVITAPSDGADDVALDADISWNAVADASGYRMFIGTTAGGSEVVNGEQVMGTEFTPPGGLEENTTYYVRVIPYNTAGQATGCAEINFTTETLLARPDCAVITAPADGAEDVAVDAGISWNAVADASGYRVYIGTTAGGSEVVGGEQVTGTSFTPPAGFDENTIYYVRVIPYNAAGRATGCVEISFTTETILTKPDCADITAPADGAEDVAVNAGISWNAVAGASGYRVYIGTTAGGSEVVDGEQVTGTSFNPPADLEENTAYYVRVVPYNAAGRATGCAEISFTTETILTKPDCADITAPADGAEDVAVDAGISWNAVADASGYRVYIGTTAGGSEVVDGEQVTGTSFNPPADFDENTTYYVRVIPYNAAGSASGCTEISFETGSLQTAPDCADIIAPADDAEDVAVDANISWNTVADASSYRIFIGTTAGGSEVIDGDQVTGTSFNPPGDLGENTTYYVRVIPYNAAGRATGCAEISFTTETILTKPDCAVITTPTDGTEDVAVDANISWNAVADASGYRVYIGTTAGGSEVVGGEQVTGTSFNPPADFDENITYYARVIPYNAAGSASGCIEISFETGSLQTTPDCAVITAPADGAEDVAVNANINWNTVADADGYRVFIGTTAGGTDVMNGEEVTGTNFIPPVDLAENTTYYVRIIPFNAAGTASGCAEISFTTETIQTKPDCADITAPADEATDVALNADISWNAVPDASGYRVYIGTTAGGSEVVSGEEVTGTSFNSPADFDENTTYYVRVIPYNAAGSASGCTETSFETGSLQTTPDCADITAPADRAEDVAVNANINWNAVADADGYRVFIGTTAGGSDVVNGEEVTGTNFIPPVDLAENTTYYVRIIPYNAAGAASPCTEISFTTETSKNISRTKYGISPNGDGINDIWEIEGIERYPENTVSVYNRWGDMVFHIRNYDNQSNVFTGEANRLTQLGAGALPPATYFFKIRYRTNEGTDNVEGFLVLRR